MIVEILNNCISTGFAKLYVGVLTRIWWINVCEAINYTVNIWMTKRKNFFARRKYNNNNFSTTKRAKLTSFFEKTSSSF